MLPFDGEIKMYIYMPPSTVFCEIGSVVFLRDPANKLTNGDEIITSLAEVTKQIGPVSVRYEAVY